MYSPISERRGSWVAKTRINIVKVIQPLCFCCQNESYIALRQIDWGWKPPWEGMGTTSPSPALFKSRPSTHSHDAKLLHNTTLHCFHQTIMKVTVSPLTVPAAVKITVESGVTSTQQSQKRQKCQKGWSRRLPITLLPIFTWAYRKNFKDFCLSHLILSVKLEC